VRSNLELEQQATDYRNNGQVEKAVAAYRELIERFEANDEGVRAAEMQHMVGVSYKVGNFTEKSLAALSDTLERYRKLESTVNVGRVLRDLGITYQYAHRFEEAQPFLEESIEVLAGAGDAAELGISQVKLGHLFHEMKQLEPAEEWIEEGIRTLEQTDQWFYQATALLHQADLQITQGRYEEALTSSEAAETLLRAHQGETSQKRRLAQVYYLKSAIYHGLHDEKKAGDAKERAEGYTATLDKASGDYLHAKLEERNA
jgi:tetratricopeptide (TPR) repeat protein